MPELAGAAGRIADRLTGPGRDAVHHGGAEVPRPSEEDLAVLASAAPMMPGAEYLTAEVLGALAAARSGLHRRAESGGTVQEFKRLNPPWNVVGRVHCRVSAAT